MYVPMELARVVITEFSGDQYIFLRERDGERTLPIAIGIHEALAIDRRLKGQKTQRPMTHDLLANVIERLGAELQKIHIHDLRMIEPDDLRSTFIATIFLSRAGEVLEIDSRPSDAIALGSAYETPIFVAEEVLADALDDSPEHRLQMLRQHQRVLETQIHELRSRLDDEQFVQQAPAELLDKARQRLEQMENEHQAIRKIISMFD